MFESYIASLLDGYIGQYVEGFDLKQFGLRDTILKDLSIRSDAFNGLDLAVRVKCGNVGSIRLKIPINVLAYPIVIEVKDVFAVLIPERSSHDAKKSMRRKFLKKMQSLERLAKSRLRAMLESETSSSSSEDDSSSWGWKWKSVLSRIVSNLKISIERVHVRLEDQETLRSEPFAMGMYLHSVSVAPSTIESSAALKNRYLCRSMLQVTNLALYLIPSSFSASSSTKLKRRTTHGSKKRGSMKLILKTSYEEVLRGRADCSSISTMRFFMRKVFLVQDTPSLSDMIGVFLVPPADGIARLEILEPSKKATRDEPIVSISVQTRPLHIHINRSQYLAMAGFVDTVSNFQLNSRYRTCRPSSGPPCRKKRKNCREWWKYAIEATIKIRNRDLAEQNRKAWTSTEEFRKCLAEWRVEYMLLYIRKLNGDPEQSWKKRLEEIHHALEFHIIRKFQEQSEKIWIEQRERRKENTWLGWVWGNGNDLNSKDALIKEMERVIKEENSSSELISSSLSSAPSTQQTHDDDMLMRFNVTLSSFQFHIHFPQQGYSDLNISFDELETNLTYRRKYFQVRAMVGDAKVCHYDRSASVVCELVRRRRRGCEDHEEEKSSSETRRAMKLDLSFPEYPPPSKEIVRADVSVKLESSAFDIVVSVDVMDRISRFFAANESLNHRVMQKWLNERLQIDALRHATLDNISSALLSRQRFRLDINAAAPRLLIPETYDQEENKSSVLVVVDGGRLGILSSPSDTSLYDMIHVRSENIRVVVMRTMSGTTWRVPSKVLEHYSSENILLEDLSLHIQIDVLAVDDRFRSNFNIKVL